MAAGSRQAEVGERDSPGLFDRCCRWSLDRARAVAPDARKDQGMSGATRKRLAVVPADGAGEDRAKPPIHSSKAAAGSPGGAPDGGAGRGHGPYSKRPRGPALLPAERQAMLAEPLDGVRLYAFDRQALDWLCRWLDTPTFLALLGLIERARQAAAGHAGTPQHEGSQP